MKPLTLFGLMAEKHWREFLPWMVAELEAKGQLHEKLLTAEDQTEAELDHRHPIVTQKQVKTIQFPRKSRISAPKPFGSI